MPLLRVQAFLNTRDIEDDVDLLAEPAAARDWLIEAGLLTAGGEVAGADLELGREVRDCLRSLLAEGGDGPEREAEELAVLRKLAAEHSARLTVGGGGVLGIGDACGDTLGDGLFQISPDHPRRAGGRDVVAPQGVREPGLCVGVLRPLAQPAGELVQHGRLRQQVEEPPTPRPPAVSGSPAVGGICRRTKVGLPALEVLSARGGVPGAFGGRASAEDEHRKLIRERLEGEEATGPATELKRRLRRRIRGPRARSQSRPRNATEGASEGRGAGRAAAAPLSKTVTF